MDVDEVRELRDRLTAIVRRVRREQAPVEGLSQSGLRVLHAASRLSAAQPARLAEETRMATSNVAAALRELEAAGLVGRQRNGEDSRRIDVELTTAGADLVAATRGARDVWLARAIEAELDEGEQRLLVAAGELLARLADHDERQGR